MGQRLTGIGSRRRYATNSCGDVPCAALGANPGQQFVGGRSTDQRRAHHCPALSRPDGRAERGLIARRVEQTLICGVKALVRRYAPGYFHASDRLERSALPLRSKPVSTLDERGVLAPKDFAFQSESLCAAPKRRKTV